MQSSKAKAAPDASPLAAEYMDAGPGADRPGADRPGADGPGADGPGVRTETLSALPGQPDLPKPRLYSLAEVDSTNNWAKARLRELSHLDAVCAASQTAGKGRLGRGWANAGPQALYYTIVCKTPLADPASLPLLASLAAAGAVREEFGLACQIKWPNDLLAGGKKLCGILCEATPDGIVCGIGVNLLQSAAFFAAEGLPYATSVAAALGGDASVPADAGPDAAHGGPFGGSAGQDAAPGGPWNGGGQAAGSAGSNAKTALPPDAAHRLAVRISAQFAALLPGFAQDGFAALREEYKARCVNLGRPVEFAGGRGVARDIDENGRLVVETEGGSRAVFTGEVSVRGIYGRV